MPVETEISRANLHAHSCSSGYDHFLQELAAGSAMRMLMNNLDEEVAERPQDWWSMVERGGRHAVGNVPGDHRDAKDTRQRRDPAGAVGKPVGVFRRTSTRRVC